MRIAYICAAFAISIIGVAACSNESTPAPSTSSTPVTISSPTTIQKAEQTSSETGQSSAAEQTGGYTEADYISFDHSYCHDLVVENAENATDIEFKCIKEMSAAIERMGMQNADTNHDGIVSNSEMVQHFDTPLAFMNTLGHDIRIPNTPHYENYHVVGPFESGEICEAERKTYGGQTRLCNLSQDDQYYFEYYRP